MSMTIHTMSFVSTILFSCRYSFNVRGLKHMYDVSDTQTDYDILQFESVSSTPRGCVFLSSSLSLSVRLSLCLNACLPYVSAFSVSTFTLDIDKCTKLPKNCNTQIQIPVAQNTAV